MNVDRWQQIECLYHAALALNVEERGVFLDEACQNDDGLRAEVESLLIYESESTEFLEWMQPQSPENDVVHDVTAAGGYKPVLRFIQLWLRRKLSS